MDAYTRNQGDIQDAVATALGRDKTDAEPWIDLPDLASTIGDAVSSGFSAAVNSLGWTGNTAPASPATGSYQPSSGIGSDALFTSIDGPDPDALRQAMESGGTYAQQSIEAAARSINEQGSAGGSAFINMLTGITQLGREGGAAFGDAAASSFNAKVRIPAPGAPAALPRANANPGVTMPAVGTPGGSP
jgi:hypothetical protein